MKEAVPATPNPAPHPQLQQDLLRRIRELSFPAYCHLIRLLLYRSGYTSVQIMEPDVSLAPKSDATPPLSSRRLLYSGLLAVSHTDLASALTLVRVKQAKGVPVSRRFIDQLRGAMLRLGAEQGLLIATGRFSCYARNAAASSPLPPIRLIDGDSLCAMLIERGLGVGSAQGKSSDTAGSVEESFFAHLEARAERQKRQSQEEQYQKAPQSRKKTGFKQPAR